MHSQKSILSALVDTDEISVVDAGSIDDDVDESRDDEEDVDNVNVDDENINDENFDDVGMAVNATTTFADWVSQQMFFFFEKKDSELNFAVIENKKLKKQIVNLEKEMQEEHKEKKEVEERNKNLEEELINARKTIDELVERNRDFPKAFDNLGFVEKN